MLVVGAGFAGSVCARRMAEELGLRVLVVDRRGHLAGNAHDAPDEHGILCHSYGPHIFHTSAPRVSRFLSRFTDWRPYQHRVLAEVDGRFVPVPINLTTVRVLHDVELAGENELAPHSTPSPSRARSSRPLRTPSSRRSGVTSTSACSAVTRASSGRSIPASCTPRCAAASRCG